MNDYPELAAWLHQVGAYFIGRVHLGVDTTTIAHAIELWRERTSPTFLIEILPLGEGWNIYTAPITRSTTEKLADAAHRARLPTPRGP